MGESSIPDELVAVFREFRTCELTTLTGDAAPVTWPLTSLYLPEEKRFFLATSIGLPQKAFNIRRNPRVSLFFSDPTASGLENPPAVLVQGDAEAPDGVATWSPELEALARSVFRRQPAGELYSRIGVLRYLFDWYYMRLVINVIPRRLLWWSGADFTRAPRVLRLDDVA